jgi:indole-3-acetate monooxygenase
MTHAAPVPYGHFARCGWPASGRTVVVRAAGGAAAEEDTMTASLVTETTPDAPVLEAVRELAPVIAGRATEIEAARRLPRDLLDDLVAAGCFRMLLPPSHGGDGVDLMTAMRVLEELSRADASVGWTVGLGANAWRDVCPLPRDVFDTMYAPGRDVIAGGAINPSGVAEPVDGGYRVTGRWAFVSGCEHCDWLFGNCVERTTDGEGDTGGPPVLRMAVFARDQVEIQDTWSVSGLCGTGSHHVVADGVTLPADRTYLVLEDEPTLDEPFVRIPLPTPYALQVAALALGIAQGALDDILALAATKVPLFAGTSLAANPLFQHQLGGADAQVRAARAVLLADAEEVWATASAGVTFSTGLRARVRASSTWATEVAAAVVDTAYTAGGGSSLYQSSPLQRRLRDIHALTQHFLIKADTLTTAGAVLAGQEVDTTFL